MTNVFIRFFLSFIIFQSLIHQGNSSTAVLMNERAEIIDMFQSLIHQGNSSTPTNNPRYQARNAIAVSIPYSSGEFINISGW